MLKDVLRNYDGLNTHTVHLVCAPSKNKIEIPKPAPKMNDSQTRASNSPESSLNQSTHSSTTGLNQTASSNVINRDSVPDFRTVWATIAQTYPTFPDPNQYAVHAAIMQQAYAQYINQYMQM